MSFIARRQAGFTIVELLIVIVVIAILATISVVAYSGIQDRAYDSMVESELSTAIKKLEEAKVILGNYPESASQFPDDFRFNRDTYDISRDNFFYCLDKANSRYVLVVRSKSKKYYIANTGKISVGTLSAYYAAQVCPIIGKTWTNNETTYVVHGFEAPSTWRTSYFPWIRE